MSRHLRSLIYGAVALLACPILSAMPSPEKEFLTPLEIGKIQDAQEIDLRIKVYLEAAALRLKTAEERLGGKEAEPGDPLEFFSVEEMVDGYYRIVKSVMTNVDDAFQRRDSDKNKLGKALKNLRDSTETAGKILPVLKKIAEDKRNEELWNLVNQAIEITNGAHEGAEIGEVRLEEPVECLHLSSLLWQGSRLEDNGESAGTSMWPELTVREDCRERTGILPGLSSGGRCA